MATVNNYFDFTDFKEINFTFVKDQKSCLQKINDARCVTLEVHQGDRRIVCYVDVTRNNEKRTGEWIYRY